MSLTDPNTVIFDDVAYDASSLSKEAMGHVANLQVTDRKIAETEQDLAILRTARMAYASALRAALPKKAIG
ncbi:hypothetical protein [Jiella sp. M17.18]|uniref:hypothetical protein n=1 Tax=Jiella sp. M17.18 TaxID=3234247 RepID=UPI0034DE2530